jgi:hypothetical protein
VIVSTSTSRAASKDPELWTLRSLLARHRGVAVGLAALILLLVATILLSVMGSKAGAVSDSTSCTQWGTANQARQAAYAKLYVKEHGPLRGGGRSSAQIIAAINSGCARAYGDDVSDSVTVTQAISGHF